MLKLAGWILLLFLVLWFPFAMLEILAYSRISDRRPADAAVVLGAAVWNDEPSPVFRERIRHAIDLYRGGQVRAIIFTGGTGPGDMVAEGQAGKTLALQEGVPTSALFFENQSGTTYENLRGASEIAGQHGLKRLLVVSDPLHMRRAMLMARDLGLDAHPSPTPTTRYRGARTQLRFLLRETKNYILYLVSRPFTTMRPAQALQ